MNRLRNEIAFFLYAWRQNVRDAMGLRASFLMQFGAMFLTNFVFFVMWLSFSHSLGPVNGWDALSTFGLISCSLLTYGLAHVLFGSLGSWQERVASGGLDMLLCKPKNIYTTILNLKWRPSVCADLLQGLLGIVIFFLMRGTSLEGILLATLAILAGSVVFVAYSVTVSSLIFLFPQNPRIIGAFYDLFMIPSLQPVSLLQDPLRSFYLLAVPALVVSGLPVEIAQEASVAKLLVALGVAIGWLWLSMLALQRGIRRYESGNLPL